MCVCGDDWKSVKFKIIPNKLGRIPLTVKAITSEARLCPNSTVYAADAVTRKLLVEVGYMYYSCYYWFTTVIIIHVDFKRKVRNLRSLFKAG